MGNFPSSAHETNDSTTGDKEDDCSSSLLALVAVSHALTISPLQILELRQHCRVGSLGQKQTRPKISRSSFSKAMARSQISSRPTIQVLEHLFSMWDQDGTERVDYIEFCTATSVLASCCEYSSVNDVILFAMQVQDVHDTHCITRAKLESLLNGINMTAAYFGDAVLSTKQVQTIAHDVFESQQLHHHVMSHEECARRVQKHALVEEFHLGKGEFRYNVSKHVLQPDKKEDLIVRLLHQDDAQGGGVPSTEIGTSTCSDEHNEI